MSDRDTYTIQGLSEAQIVEIRDALELKARLGMGQTEDLLRCFPLPWRRHDYLLSVVRELLLALAHIVAESTSGYYSMASDHVPVTAKRAWDLYQVVRHCIAWTNEPHGGIYVQFDDPMPVLQEALPKVTSTTEGSHGTTAH